MDIDGDGRKVSSRSRDRVEQVGILISFLGRIGQTEVN